MGLMRYFRRCRRRTLVLIVLAYWCCTITIIYLAERNKPSKEDRATQTLFSTWQHNKKVTCSGQFSGYVNQFALLRHVLVDTKRFVSARAGGEKIEQVMNQSENLEYFHCLPGAFQLTCNINRIPYKFGPDNHLGQWMGNLTTVNGFELPYTSVRTFTIAVQRYEYADLYRTMTDWYNAFLMMEFFNKTKNETNVLLVDAHPWGVLDSGWSTLFGRMQRLKSLPDQVLFSELAWSIMGYNSQLSHFSHNLPLIERFRNFFLSGYNIEDSHKLNCNELNILIVWRRRLIAHPRNPAGRVTGKIANETQLLEYVRNAYPNHIVQGVHVEALELGSQLRMTSRTDVLIGVHGSALAHSIFLPRHAGLIQLYSRKPALDQYRNIVRARHLHYQYWDADLNELEPLTINVPPKKVLNLLKSIIHDMC